MAVGDTRQSILTKLYVASGAPATEDEAGYEALTWVRVMNPLSLPERGDTTEDVSEAALDDGRAEHFNGTKDGGSLPIPFKWIEGDAGQAILLAATGGNETYSFKEVDPNGTDCAAYFGRLSPAKIRESSPNSFKGFTSTIMVNSARVEYNTGD